MTKCPKCSAKAVAKTYEYVYEYYKCHECGFIILPKSASDDYFYAQLGMISPRAKFMEETNATNK